MTKRHCIFCDSNKVIMKLEQLTMNEKGEIETITGEQTFNYFCIECRKLWNFDLVELSR